MMLTKLYKFAECLVVLMIAAWLLYPYPYTWKEITAINPVLGYGQLIPVFWYGYLMYRARRPSSRN